MKKLNKKKLEFKKVTVVELVKLSQIRGGLNSTSVGGTHTDPNEPQLVVKP